MKTALAVLALCAFVNALSNRFARHHHISQNVTEIISGYGYPVQNISVTTTDGYMLDLIRIPGGVEYKSKFNRLQREHGSEENVRTDRPAVLLWHAMLSSCEDFVIGGPTEGLAFVLADAGYDVFIGNSRGSSYGHRHTTLNPDKDVAFWNFCFEDIGKKDMPAVIDAILEVTSMSKMVFIGHMEGNTPFYVLTSEMPEYNNKIQIAISMGPVVYMKNTSNPAIKVISENYKSKTWAIKNLGSNEFHPSTDFVSQVNQDCVAQGVNERICQNPFFLINGYESSNMNQTTINKYMYRLPSGTSTVNVLHYGQMVSTGRFETYYEDSTTTREYDLSKVIVPVAVIFAPKDKLVVETDMERLLTKLPNVVETVRVSQVTNNLDLLFANNVRNVVYNSIVNIIKNH